MSLKPWRKAVLLVPALALIVSAGAACGGDDDDDDSGDNGTATTAATKTTTVTTEVPSGAPFVDQDGLEFKPTKVTAKVGEKVYFKNSETAIHTVTIEGKNVSGNMKKNDVVIWTPEKAGEFKVTCDYHPQMKATITVQ